MKEFEEKIYKNGLLKISYTLIKGITPINALVLSRLIEERDYAVKNNFITDDGFFIADETELSYSTGLQEEVICNIVKNLIRRNIIKGKKIDDFCLVHIDEEKIIELVSEFENQQSKDFAPLDAKLEKIQKNILKLNKSRKNEDRNDTTFTNKKFSGLKFTENIETDDPNNKSFVSEPK